MRPEFLSILGEARIARERPAGVIVAIVCSGMAAMVILMMSPLFILTGLFVAGPMLWIGGAIVGLAAVNLVPLWGLFRGHLWAFFATVWLAVASAILACCMIAVGSPILTALAASLLLLHLRAQCLLWNAETRRWFSRSHRLRSHGYRELEGTFGLM